MKKTILICLATIAGTLGIHAANLTWDFDTGTTGAQDGLGTWNNVLNNWWDGAANVTWNNATPDNATFGAGSGAAGVVTVPGNTTNTVGNITFSAAGSGGYNIAGGSSTTSKINLSGTPTITVASGVFATNLVVLSGTSFTKLGAGLLSLKGGGPNINTGPTVVGGGTLLIGTSAGRLVIPGDLTITNGSIGQLIANEQIADAAILTLDNGTFDMGSRTETINSLILDNNSAIPATSSSAILTASTIFDVRSGTITAGLAGAAKLVKTTGGTVLLASGSETDTYTGGTLISAGILDSFRSGTGLGIPTGIITITNTGMLRLQKDNQVSLSATINVASGTFELLAHNDNAGTVILDNGGQILNTGNTSKTLTVSTNMDFRNGTCSSVLAGAGILTKSTAATVTLAGDNNYTGGTLVSGGILQIGDGSGGNRGKLGTGPVTNNAAIVLNHSGAFTLVNVISGSGSLTNLGGSATLTGASTYSGGTIVSGGTLLINNAIGNGTVNVQSGASLGGIGTVGGATTIQSGGNFLPGNGGVGTLTVNGSLVLNAGSASTFQVDGTTLAKDVVVAGSSVTYGGTLNITTTGTFTNGQQFVLFSGAGATNAGNFASLTGSPGVDLAFNFTNGVLSVVSTGGAAPTLGFSVAGSTLTFSWSDAAFHLQSQTNTLATGLNTNWSDYPGGGSSPVNATINPADPTVFFRLSQ